MEELEAKRLLETTADTISEIKTERFASTLGHNDFDARLNTLVHTLAQLQVKKPAEKLCDVKVLPLVDMLAYILEEKKKTTLAANRGEM